MHAALDGPSTRGGHREPGGALDPVDEVADRALAVRLRGLLARGDVARLVVHERGRHEVHEPRRRGAREGAADGVTNDLVHDGPHDRRRLREGFAILSLLSTSMPWRRAAPTIFWRAFSLAVALWKSVWFHRAMALRICDSSLIGRCSPPFRSTYAN